MSDLYDGRLRRWSLDMATGRKACVHDAVRVDLISDEDRAAVEAHNTAIHQAIADVEAYEAAQRVPLPDEPHTQPMYDDEGEEVGTEPTPAYATWTAAQAAIDNASAEIRALALVRAGEPERFDEAGAETEAWQAWSAAVEAIAEEWGDEPEIAVAHASGADVNRERDRRIVAGKSFTVLTGGYGDIPLTGREEDKVALMGLLVKAQGAKAMGITAPVMTLRDGANVNHALTPDQMIELVSKGMSWIEDVMAASWAMKDGTAPFEAGIPADYTDDGYWP